MKKFSHFLLMSLASLIIIISSCNDKEETKANAKLTARKVSFNTLNINFSKDLNEKLYKEVMDGKIKAYRFDSLTPTCMFKPEEIKNLSTLEESIQYAPDSTNPDFLIDTVLKQTFSPGEIVGYSIAEQWTYDAKDNETECTVFALAVNWQPKIMGIQIPESSLFWVDYKDVTKLLTKEQTEELNKAIYNSLIVRLSEF